MRLIKSVIGRKAVLSAIWRFIMFFALMSFVVTCNFFLFLHSVHMDEAEIRAAAPITFLNVILITILFCVVDIIRRMWMVTRPVKRIQEGIERIVEGDFDVRIPYLKGENSGNEFDSIIKGLNDMTAELAGVETLRTDFISNVSHEIKTPLAVIQNYGTMLQSGVLSEKQRQEYAKAITEQICECLLMFEYAWEKKNLEIETDMEDDVIICQDEELLSLVWNNLFSNAIKFCKENGTVTVKIQTDDRKVFVEVKDTGCGISSDIGRHIFEKFYQGDTSHATQGNGLGLALVKRVIDITGGDISVQSVLGEGTAFKVTFDL